MVTREHPQKVARWVELMSVPKYQNDFATVLGVKSPRRETFLEGKKTIVKRLSPINILQSRAEVIGWLAPSRKVPEVLSLRQAFRREAKAAGGIP